MEKELVDFATGGIELGHREGFFIDDRTAPPTTRVSRAVEVVVTHRGVRATRDVLDRDRVTDRDRDLRFTTPDLVRVRALKRREAVLAGHPLVAGTSGVPVGVAGAAAFGPLDGELAGGLDFDSLGHEGVRVPGLDIVRAGFVHQVGARGAGAGGVDSVDGHFHPFEGGGGHDGGFEVVDSGVVAGVHRFVPVVVVRIAAPHREGEGQRDQGQEAVVGRVHGFPLSAPRGCVTQTILGQRPFAGLLKDPARCGRAVISRSHWWGTRVTYQWLRLRRSKTLTKEQCI